MGWLQNDRSDVQGSIYFFIIGGLGMKNGAIITGANRGIGKKIVERFADEGYENIWACARKYNELFESEINKIAQEKNINIYPIYFDIANEEEMKDAVKKIRSDKKQIDVLVNAAGVLNTDMFFMTAISKMKEVFDVNFFGTVAFTQYILKLMMRQKTGSIINIASIAGLDANPTNCTYGSSKAALISFSRILASEVAEYGIRVNAIAPGPTDTDMGLQVKEKIGENLLSNCAMNRFAKTEEIADLVAFLASDKSSFINGQVIRIDGGAK